MILLVVKHEETHTALVPLIKSKGFEAFPAACGDEALHCVRTFRPKLIVLDCGMPDSFDMVAAIRQETPGSTTPIVMFSHDEADVKERALRCGADGFVAKGSLDWAHLLDAICRFITPPVKGAEPTT